VRTTLDIDDDLIDALRPLAAGQKRSLGRVISDLVRASMQAQSGEATRNGFPVFDVPADAAMFGADAVARALDE
jgi:hypothetical protein